MPPSRPRCQSNRMLKQKLFVLLTVVLALPASTFAQEPAAERREFSLPATKARGLPLADAVLVGNTLYISGRGGVDLATMKVPADIKDEVTLMMEDYKAILALAGMTMDDLVSVTIYSPDLSLYAPF